MVKKIFNKAQAIKIVNLDHLAYNYKQIQNYVEKAFLAASSKSINTEASHAEIAGVVKADGYGCGVRQISETLIKNGCKTLFTATLGEACQIRDFFPDVQIFALNGPWFSTVEASLVQTSDNELERYIAYRIIPVVNDLGQLRIWKGYLQNRSKDNGAFSYLKNSYYGAVHIDTGMNRLGLTLPEFHQALSEELIPDQGQGWLIMSHLATADDPSANFNQLQLQRFQNVQTKLPKAKASLSASGGIFLGCEYHFDLIRAGYSLYGGRVSEKSILSIKPVIELLVPIMRIRTVKKGETIGYGCHYQFSEDTQVALLQIGYADGLFRYLADGGLSDVDKELACVFIHNHPCRIVGRISMDSLAVDLGALDGVKIGDMAEIVGAHQTIDELAHKAGTIGYEILPALKGRYITQYIKDGEKLL